MRTWSILIYLFLLYFSYVQSYRTVDAKATKGKFFTYTLHSASFFNSTVPVRWSATSKNRPVLPQWLKLVESRYSALAYLIGTPVTPHKQVLVHVVATRVEDTFESQQQQIAITLEEDDRFIRSTAEVLQITIKNYNPEDILTDRRHNLIPMLEQAVSNSFGADFSYPYIYDMTPELHILPKNVAQFQNNGTILSIGTQTRFSKRLHGFVASFARRPGACRKNHMIPVNRNFYPTFEIDWCQTKLKNATLIRDAHGNAGAPETVASIQLEGYQDTRLESPPHQVSSLNNGLSFLEGILLFPIIAVVCIFLVLILSIIFFGKREGQQWRDYKTTRQQLEEFATVRETQRHLRELSIQRQLFLMSNEGYEQVVSGVRTFLQPKPNTGIRDPRYRMEQEVNSQEKEKLGMSMEVLPVGKQTVADAAKQYGGSLHFYKNPFESESDEKSDAEAPPSGHSAYH